jgi:hypothetical protein
MVKAYRIRSKTSSCDSKNNKNNNVICLRHTSKIPEESKSKGTVVSSLRLEKDNLKFLQNKLKASKRGD